MVFNSQGKRKLDGTIQAHSNSLAEPGEIIASYEITYRISALRLRKQEIVFQHTHSNGNLKKKTKAYRFDCNVRILNCKYTSARLELSAIPFQADKLIRS
jgi:hypothetical protein